MPKRLFTSGWGVVALLVLVTVCLPSSAAMANEGAAWQQTLTQRIPRRPAGALTGSQFVAGVSRLDEHQREQAILEQLLAGNLPAFLRSLKPIHLQQRRRNGKLVKATIFVTPDYLAIGSQADFIRIPMNYYTACRIAARFGCMLPTRRMVDAIYSQSAYHFRPQPMTPGPQMRSTDYYRRHNGKIAQQRLSHGIALGALVSGHKKDVVISNRLMTHPGRIAIYGWHRGNGQPIQPLSTVHGAGYADYSHGIRLVSQKMLIDGKVCPVVDVLKDPELAGLLTDEGPMAHLSQLIGGPALS